MGLFGEFSGEPADLFELLGCELTTPDNRPDFARRQKLGAPDPHHGAGPENLAGGQGEGRAMRGPGLRLGRELEGDVHPQALLATGLDHGLRELQATIHFPAGAEPPAKVGQGVLGLQREEVCLVVPGPPLPLLVKRRAEGVEVPMEVGLPPAVLLMDVGK